MSIQTASKQETSAKLKVAINGFGRIGRNFLRCWNGRENSLLDVVAINDSGGVKQVRINHTARYFPHTISGTTIGSLTDIVDY